MLGIMHLEGEGGPQDLAEARRLLSLAAEQGDVRACATKMTVLTEAEQLAKEHADADAMMAQLLAEDQAEKARSAAKSKKKKKKGASAAPPSGRSAEAAAASDAARRDAMAAGKPESFTPSLSLILALARSLSLSPTLSLPLSLALALTLTLTLTRGA